MLAPHRRVTSSEAEDAPGRHATGRSAAFWHETYGGAQIQPLSIASFDSLARPAADLAERSFLSPRVALTIGRIEERAAVDAYVREYAASGVAVERLYGKALAARVTALRPDCLEGPREPPSRDFAVPPPPLSYPRPHNRAQAHHSHRSPL